MSKEAHPVNLSDIRFPRELEADGAAEAIRRALMACTVKLWPGGTFEVARITIGDPLEKALRAARLQGRIRFGFEAIVDRLGSEEKGIMKVRGRKEAPYGDRVSRLILFSNDGAERFYRHVESLLEANSPRLLGCLLDIDGRSLGSLITGKDRPIKIVMAEHKEAVSQVLRAMVADRNV
ncbi:MAG: hypothetical protein LLG97_03045 [Deltaproteobacteria bacterium]|nr:hypothetical protein [Deltaproteobacteria bacterium]